MIKNPELIDLPMPIRTPRLIVKPIELDDVGPMLEAIHESRENLRKWMSWAENIASFEEYQEKVASSIEDYKARQGFWMVSFTHDGRFVGSTGFHNVNWKVPRCEIGYWCRISEQGKGYVTEMTNAMTRYAFEMLGMRKVMIGMDTENIPSENVARRLDYIHEFDDIGGMVIPNCDALRTKRVYSRFDTKALPALDVSW